MTLIFLFGDSYPEYLFFLNILNDDKNTLLMLIDFSEIYPMFRVMLTSLEIFSIWTFAFDCMCFTLSLGFERMSFIKWAIKFHIYYE